VKNWWYTTRWLLGSQFAARALGLLNNVLLARLLAPVSYGDFTQAMAIAGSLAPLADTGISAIITRYVARRPRSSTVLGAAIGLRIGQSLLLWGIMVLGSWWIHGASRLSLALMLAGAYWALACIQQLLAGVARARLQAQIETRAVALERVSTVLLAAAGALWFGLTGALAGVLGGGIFALITYLRCLPLPRVRLHWRIWKRLIALGTPLAIADVCHGFIMRVDILAVGMRYGSQSAGWYGSASVLLWAGNLVAGSMALALVPAAAAQRGEDAGLGLRVLGWMLATAMALATALGVGASLWIPLLYGEAYEPAVPVLRVLAWCLLPASVVAWGNAVLLVRHRTAWVGAVAIAGTLCMFACLWWWVPRYGLLGAGTAQLATQCIMASSLMLLVSQEKRQSG
jgi:O-antigen/teichoic acid export membrane protein